MQNLYSKPHFVLLFYLYHPEWSLRTRCDLGRLLPYHSLGRVVIIQTDNSLREVRASLEKPVPNIYNKGSFARR